jgi:hypothetical protein
MGRIRSILFAGLETLENFACRFWEIEAEGTSHARYTLNVTNHMNFNAVYNNVASPNFGNFAGFLYRHEGAIIDFVD